MDVGARAMRVVLGEWSARTGFVWWSVVGGSAVRLSARQNNDDRRLWRKLPDSACVAQHQERADNGHSRGCRYAHLTDPQDLTSALLFADAMHDRLRSVISKACTFAQTDSHVGSATPSGHPSDRRFAHARAQDAPPSRVGVGVGAGAGGGGHAVGSMTSAAATDSGAAARMSGCSFFMTAPLRPGLSAQRDTLRRS